MVTQSPAYLYAQGTQNQVLKIKHRNSKYENKHRNSRTAVYCLYAQGKLKTGAQEQTLNFDVCSCLLYAQGKPK